MKKLRVLIAASTLTLGKGGLERNATRIANALSLRGHTVCIAFFAQYGLYPAFPLQKLVQLLPCDGTPHAKSLAATTAKLECFSPDVALIMESSAVHLYWAVALLPTNIPHIYSERTSPIAIERERWNRPGRLAAMSCAEGIHLLFESYKSSLPSFLLPRVRIIGNAAPDKTVASGAQHKQEKYCILSVNRLEPSKQIGMLLEAFQSLSSDFPDWILKIIGTGSELSKLKKIYDNKNIVFISSVEDSIYKADIFCTPSRYEGFPNAVLEAFSHGIPVVGFSQCSGVNELVKHGINGLLVSSMTVEDLAGTLRCMMLHEAERLRLGKNALQTCDTYSEKNIMDMWESWLLELADQGAVKKQGFKKEIFRVPAYLSILARQEKILASAKMMKA